MSRRSYHDLFHHYNGNVGNSSFFIIGSGLSIIRFLLILILFFISDGAIMFENLRLDDLLRVYLTLNGQETLDQNWEVETLNQNHERPSSTPATIVQQLTRCIKII